MAGLNSAEEMAVALVTGATGFIGGHLVKRLHENGDTVRCLVRATSARKPLEPYVSEFVVGDLRKPNSVVRSVQGVDVVYHLAGATRGFGQGDFDDINVDALREFAVVCAAQPNPPRFVHISSLAAAGISPIGSPRNESLPMNPVSQYGISKKRGEQVLRGFAKQLAISIVRPPVVFGPGDMDSLQLFRPIKRLRVNPIPINRRRQCSFVAVEDLVEALVAVAGNGKRISESVDDADGVYFVADPNLISFKEFGQMIARSIGNKWVWTVTIIRPAVWGTAAVNEVIARIKGKQSVMNFDKAREVCAGSWTCSPEKIQNELKFEPQKTLQERFNDTISWYVDHGLM
ncbi:MAG: NAD-dependent epimerase/dehydratase family protein [Pirellulaceae bacterium]